MMTFIRGLRRGLQIEYTYTDMYVYIYTHDIESHECASRRY